MTGVNGASAFAQVAAARIYNLIGKTDAAMAAFDKALAIKADPGIYLNRAMTRPRTDVAGREADADAALKLAPAMIEAFTFKAGVQIDQGDFTGAIKTYSAALEKEPENSGLLDGRGIAYAKAGDQSQADKDFAAARLKATNEAMLNNLCWSKATNDVALERALSECDAALEKAPGSPAIIDSRAFVLLRLGRIDEAIAAYDQVIAKSSGFPTSLFGRAVAWSRKGDPAKAKADFDAALKLNPQVQKEFADYGVKYQP